MKSDRATVPLASAPGRGRLLVVDDHGGTVRAEAPVSGGTLLRFSLPER
jgi:hypothetical protein